MLDSSIFNDDERIKIKGYNLLQANHASNKKGRCLYVAQRTSFYYKKRRLMHLKRMPSYENHNG